MTVMALTFKRLAHFLFCHMSRAYAYAYACAMPYVEESMSMTMS